MAKVKATVAPVAADYPLCFDEIKNVPGAYQRSGDGRILIVYSKNTKLVDDPKVRTKRTRTGQAMLLPNGTLRKVVCDDQPDGVKQWKKFAGTITLDYTQG